MRLTIKFFLSFCLILTFTHPSYAGLTESKLSVPEDEEPLMLTVIANVGESGTNREIPETPAFLGENGTLYQGLIERYRQKKISYTGETFNRNDTVYQGLVKRDMEKELSHAVKTLNRNFKKCSKLYIWALKKKNRLPEEKKQEFEQKKRKINPALDLLLKKFQEAGKKLKQLESRPNEPTERSIQAEKEICLNIFMDLNADMEKILEDVQECRELFPYYCLCLNPFSLR